MICQNSNDIEMAKLKSTNERKELEIRLREEVSENIPKVDNDDKNENVFLDMLEIITLKQDKLQIELEKSELQQKEQMNCFESNLEKKQNESQTLVEMNTELCKKDLRSEMQNFRKFFCFQLYF